LTICNLCLNLQWSKNAGLCQNADDPQPQPTKSSAKQKDLSGIEQRY